MRIIIGYPGYPDYQPPIITRRDSFSPSVLSIILPPPPQSKSTAIDSLKSHASLKLAFVFANLPDSRFGSPGDNDVTFTTRSQLHQIYLVQLVSVVFVVLGHDGAPAGPKLESQTLKRLKEPSSGIVSWNPRPV